MQSRLHNLSVSSQESERNVYEKAAVENCGGISSVRSTFNTG